MPRKSARKKAVHAPTRAARNIAWIESYCRVPEGKLIGQPIVLRDWQRNELEKIYDNPHGTRRAILSFGRKNGKGLALDTPIPTPDGWRTMGELRPGDEVFDSSGKPTKVLFVSPVHIGLRCWRLTFSDGSSIVADEQHRWLTRHSFRPWAKARRNGTGNGGRWREEVVTTPQIAMSVMRKRKDGGTEYNHKITVAPATVSPALNLPIDPYVLGAWLGDGSSDCARFTCGEQDIEPMTAALSACLGGHVSVARYSGKAPTIRTARLGLQAALRTLGVLGNKHIPEQYLNAGTEQRWGLLQGLMDTDGTVNLNGGRYPRASFTGTNKELCEGVWRLARSLGLKATINTRRAKLNGQDRGEKYDVAFSASRELPVFRLERKQVLLPLSISSRSKTLTIVSCEEVESVPTVCIKVAAENSLFLAGHGCVPTHNTALSACLLLLHLCGPESRPNSTLYSAAQSRDQAAILFSLAAKMVRMSADLSAAVHIKDSAKELICADRGTKYKALSADASTAYGLSPVFIVHDELGQVRGPRSELYEALETATGAQEAPLSIVISTQAPTENDLLSVLIDDAVKGEDPRVVVSLYAAADDLDPFSDEAIIAANPAFGDFQNAEETRAMANDAKRMPARENEFRNLILNQRVEAQSPFISRAAWEACAGSVAADWSGRRVYAGLDLSSTTDLTALVLGTRIDGVWHIRPVFWLPLEGLAEKSRNDRVPYDLWAEQGFLETTPGKSIEYEWVAEYLRGVFDDYDIANVAFDRWGFKYLKPWLLKAGFSEDEIEKFVEFGQGFQSMSPAMRDLESAILQQRLAHGGHPVLNMCMANAVVQSDPAGNRKLNKAKSSGRIDGAVALTMAIGAATNLEEEQAPTSVWERLATMTDDERHEYL